MRLKCIKLAGFKSFVDPTTISLPTNLSAIVGPNGCGKSNTIDAVRWVMGESSAKHLRGESMADVIFNGSNARKPVAQAFVELVFDNTEGRLGGEYAQYAEIAVKRLVTRDGQSNYFLNGTKCRRKDITDIFLGTGLGARSYAIIEQGMISRLIEAKPEELRIFIEEAAGISKYKERRKETENRMRRTRENLERLDDIREELERQLQHLHRQAQAAEKYKEFKEQERLLKAQLQAIKWKGLDEQVTTFESIIRDLELKIEACLTDRVSAESEIEQRREKHQALTDEFNEVQARFYGLGADIARVEQSIQHQKERHAQLSTDYADAQSGMEKVKTDLTQDQEKLEILQADIMEIEPEMELVKATEEQTSDLLMEAEEKMQSWQLEWDEFNHAASEPKQQAQVEQSRIQHLEQSLQRLRDRNIRLQQEKETLTAGPLEQEALELKEKLDAMEMDLEARQEKVDGLSGRIENQRQSNSDQANQLDQIRSELQTLKGKHASLEALQAAALGDQSDQISNWLEQQGLADQPRIAEQMHVEAGWEKALETVLGPHLQAVCVDGFDTARELIGNFEKGSISILDKTVESPQYKGQHGTLLAEKIISGPDVKSLVAGIYVVEELNQAMDLRGQLDAHESVVTKEGIWIGPNWLRVAKDEDAQAGVIKRQQELETVTQRLEELQEREMELSNVLNDGRDSLREFEIQREDAQKEVSVTNRTMGEIKSQLSGKEVRLEQILMRRERIDGEIKECESQVAVEQESLGEARLVLEQAVEKMAADTERRETLLAARDENRRILDEARQKARHDKDASHQLALRYQSLQNQIESTKSGLTRLQEQEAVLKERLVTLEESMSVGDNNPVAEQQAQLEELLEKRLRVEEELAAARRRLGEVDHELREFEKKRNDADQSAQEVRTVLETKRMDWQRLKVEREALVKQLEEEQYHLESVIEELPDEATEQEWQQSLEQMANRISRLGAINLAAIDEYKQQSERKTYLDTQHQDLMTALETLENAIRKIDRETRTRFKETFDKVNKGLQELFPKVFGGGHAYLELTGEDLLDTGITIMARPPGKRNSTIHLLSGGEKALTAIALVFSIFQLNPAPFCMLDEVDAPLDDANVGRYSRMVEEMSEKVQFIYITHNKIAMEMAQQLMGVTMHEPGVSRLVSVNVEEAAAMAAL